MLQANLPILFQDKMMQRKFIRQKERIENDRKNFIAARERIISKRPNTNSRTSPTHAKSIENVAKIGFHLPITYSQIFLVYLMYNASVTQ